MRVEGWELKEDAPEARAVSSNRVLYLVPSQLSGTALSRMDSTSEFMLTRLRAAWMAILR